MKATVESIPCCFILRNRKQMDVIQEVRESALNIPKCASNTLKRHFDWLCIHNLSQPIGRAQSGSSTNCFQLVYQNLATLPYHSRIISHRSSGLVGNIVAINKRLNGP